MALRQSDVDFILSQLPAQPFAFENKETARRHYGKRHCKRLGVEQGEIVIGRVIRKFTAELQCSKEFRHLSPDELVRKGYVRLELKIRNLPKLRLLKDGTWAPELRDLMNAQRMVL